MKRINLRIPSEPLFGDSSQHQINYNKFLSSPRGRTKRANLCINVRRSGTLYDGTFATANNPVIRCSNSFCQLCANDGWRGGGKFTLRCSMRAPTPQLLEGNPEHIKIINSWHFHSALVINREHFEIEKEWNRSDCCDWRGRRFAKRFDKKLFLFWLRCCSLGVIWGDGLASFALLPLQQRWLRFPNWKPIRSRRICIISLFSVYHSTWNMTICMCSTNTTRLNSELVHHTGDWIFGSKL